MIFSMFVLGAVVGAALLSTVVPRLIRSETDAVRAHYNSEITIMAREHAEALDTVRGDLARLFYANACPRCAARFRRIERDTRPHLSRGNGDEPS